MSNEQTKTNQSEALDESKLEDAVAEITNWEDAFDKIRQESTPGTEGAKEQSTSSASAAVEGGDSPAPSADSGLGSGDTGGYAPVDADTVGGLGTGAEETPTAEAYLEDLRTELADEAKQQVTEGFLAAKTDEGQLMVRQTNGKLGATINDPDIYRQNKDGSAAFYNPDTGKPFTGDNPRAQAKAWVDAYNEELEEVLEAASAEHLEKLMGEAQPAIDVINFAPTYDALDPVRQKLFDALIEGHEIYDKDDRHVGYSVDLTDALAMVDRQVASIQAEFGKSEETDDAATTEPPASGPALDMNTGANTNPNAGAAPKTLAEAMEQQQQKLLDDFRNAQKR